MEEIGGLVEEHDISEGQLRDSIDTWEMVVADQRKMVKIAERDLKIERDYLDIWEKRLADLKLQEVQLSLMDIE